MQHVEATDLGLDSRHISDYNSEGGNEFEGDAPEEADDVFANGGASVYLGDSRSDVSSTVSSANGTDEDDDDKNCSDETLSQLSGLSVFLAAREGRYIPQRPVEETSDHRDGSLSDSDSVCSAAIGGPLSSEARRGRRRRRQQRRQQRAREIFERMANLAGAPPQQSAEAARCYRKELEADVLPRS